MADVKITSGGKEYLDKVVQTLHPQFTTDPVINFILSNLKGQAENAYRVEWFHALIRASAIDGALFQEADGWQTAAVWMPPGRHIGTIRSYFTRGLIQVVFTLGVMGLKRMVLDYQGKTDKAKNKAMKGFAGFYYLFFIATVAEARGKGLASIVVKRFQEKATNENVPIWMEATTEHSRGVYERCGFEVVDELVLGKGTHAKSGLLEKGGPGVPVWCMRWIPEALKGKT